MVDHGLGADITTLIVKGSLNLATAAALRKALLKVLVACPVAIIADLTQCQVTNTAAYPTASAAHVAQFRECH